MIYFYNPIKKIRSKKFFALTKSNDDVGYDSNTYDFNFSKYKLNKVEKFLLFKGFQFPVPTAEVEYKILCYLLNSYVKAICLKRF